MPGRAAASSTSSGSGSPGRILLALLAADVEVELHLVVLGVGVDPFDVVLGVAGKLGVDARNQLGQRAHLARAQSPDRSRDRLEQPLDGAVPRHQLALDPGSQGLLEEQRLVERSLLLDDLREGNLVVVAVVLIDDPLAAGRAAQPHDLVHRGDALRAGVDAREAVGAVVDSMRVLRQVVEPLLCLGVARVADEPIRLRERRRPDEVGIGLHREAGGDAGAALDAGHRLGDVDHRLRRDDVLALRRIALGKQPGSDPADLLPMSRLHVGDQVLDHRHVSHRLHDDLGAAVALGLVATHLRGDGVALGIGLRLLEHRLAGERRLAVDLHPAGTADRGAAGAADGEGAVISVLGLEEAIEHREGRVEIDVEALPVGPSRSSGLKRLTLRVNSAIAPHPTQYVRSCGCHSVIVTSE